MRRLKLELKQTMDMYSSACKEALSAKQKVRWSFINAIKCLLEYLHKGQSSFYAGQLHSLNDI